jgi:5-methylcytosine-specific restriction endonuclease McrA
LRKRSQLMFTKRSALNRHTAYAWYRGTAFWRERREFILQRAGHTCEKCGKRRATEVHHLTYIRVFQELPSDLVALCRQCHAEIHWRQPANDNQLQFSFDFPEEPDEEPPEEA